MPLGAFLPVSVYKSDAMFTK